MFYCTLDSSRIALQPFLITKTGRIVGEFLTLLSHEGEKYHHKIQYKTTYFILDLFFTYSYLRGLVPVYNTVVKTDLIDPLRAKADGKTTVSMINEFTKVTLQLISQVWSTVLAIQ